MKKTRDLYDDEDSSSCESGELRLKEESEDEDDSPQPPPQLEKKHFCVICNKQFSSGKAYGGHVRIHSIEYSNKGKIKKMKMKKKRKSGAVKEREKETDLIRADVEGKIRCCLCGKEFQTLHSLFGHMRRHPDRSWKGVRPPPSPEKFKLSYLDDDVDDNDDDDDDDDDGMSRSMVMSDVTEDVQQAACILMMLNYASRNYWAGINKDMVSPKSEVRISSSCYKDGSEKEIEVKVNKPKDEANRSLRFDLNQPCHEDHPYSYWN